MSDGLNVPDYLHQHVGQLIGIQTDAACRRSMWVTVLGLAPRVDGDQFYFLWGANIQEGVCGFGPTPVAAAEAFEVAMYRTVKGEKP